MEVQSLMKPRWKVIADYPDNLFLVGDILPRGQDEGDAFIKWFKEEMADKYPHLFKPLLWWHERKEDELPKYVGYKNEKGTFNWVYPVVRWISLSLEEAGECIISYTNKDGEYSEIIQALYAVTPATESDYNNYQLQSANSNK